MRLFVLPILAAAACLAPRALADQEIVLDLPPSRELEAQRALDRPQQPKPTPPVSRSGGTLRSGPKQKVVGRLGVVNGQVSIRASRSTSSRTLVKVQPGTYVALTREAGSWYGVLMADKSTGWINSKYVKILDYEVLAPVVQERPRYADADGLLNSPLISGGQKNLLQTAYAYMGVPYEYGGTSANGIDCSAFVQQCFGTLGVRLPRTAAEQSSCGMPVSVEHLQAADRLYFASRTGRINHTGIYIGNGYFIHASGSNKRVVISNLQEGAYMRTFAGARR